MPAIIDGTKGFTNASWTTATRPASPATGQMGYNSTTGNPEWYDAAYSRWVNFGDAKCYIDYIVVAGGGAGGYSAPAGGGAGGFRTGTNFPVSTDIAYTITVGAGLNSTTITDGTYKVTTITDGTGNVSWA